METARQFDLERWQSEFEQNTARIQEIRSRNPGDQGSLRPFEGAWSVAECVQHLSITAQAFIPIWTAASASTDHNFGKPYRIWWRWFLAGINDPSRMRSSTPNAFVPGIVPHLEVVLEVYLKEREVVRALAKEMYVGDIGGIEIRSPFASWMQYPLDYSFDLWIAHERRHLSQAEKG